MTRELVSERFLLRPIDAPDVVALHRLWTNESVRRFLWDGKVIPLEETEEIVEKNRRLFQESGFGIWGVHELNSEQLLGFTGYWYFREPPSLELLFGVSSDHWNRGIATEASNCVIRHGFEGLEFQTIQASTDVANTASQRVLEKLTMSLQRRAVVDGLDTMFYRLQRNDWWKILNRYVHAPLLIFIALALAALSVNGSRVQELNQDPGHKQYLVISGLKFSSPNDFDISRLKGTEQVVFVPHEKYDVGIFVAVPDKTVDAEYLGKLSALVATYLFPKETQSYTWKKLGYQGKVSKFELGGGMMQGFNGRQRVLVQYRQIKVNGKESIAGYTFGLGRGSDARRLFDQNLGGDSMVGWFAQAHVMASITGETYKEINPGTSFRTTLIP